MMTFFEAERKTKYQCIDNITLKKKPIKYYITLFFERPAFQLN